MFRFNGLFWRLALFREVGDVVGEFFEGISFVGAVGFQYELVAFAEACLEQFHQGFAVVFVAVFDDGDGCFKAFGELDEVFGGAGVQA